ncbi:unnamed protein product [Acanthosepion pharaonis]|uniref:Uncharacterized protein n=1 Tax=Acanthosepion pharaonis TaxID=158019 RepID=A0A812BET5_ACAPH|nr:unnamed protein product [Sepia pharaonis]
MSFFFSLYSLLLLLSLPIDLFVFFISPSLLLSSSFISLFLTPLLSSFVHFLCLCFSRFSLIHFLSDTISSLFISLLSSLLTLAFFSFFVYFFIFNSSSLFLPFLCLFSLSLHFLSSPLIVILSPFISFSNSSSHFIFFLSFLSRFLSFSLSLAFFLSFLSPFLLLS